MRLPLVVGADGSEPSLHAVDWATDAATRYGVPLRIVYASRWERYEGYVPDRSPDGSAERAMEETLLGTAAERAARRAPELKVVTDLVPDDPQTALLAAGRRAKGIVVGHRGRGRLTSLLLGSVGLGVAARAKCPVVVVRGHTENVRGRTRKVVLGVGGRTANAAAVGFAFEEAALRGCAVEAVHAWRCGGGEPPELHGPHSACRVEHEEQSGQLLDEALAKQDAALPQVTVRRRVAEGAPGPVLVAASMTADLLVVGAHRRPGHTGLQLGLVNHTALHHALCPVAVVPGS